MKSFLSLWSKSGFGAALALVLYICTTGLIFFGSLPPLHVACHNMALCWVLVGLVIAIVHRRRAVTLGSSVLCSAAVVAVVVSSVYLLAGALLVPLLSALPWLTLVSVLLGLGSYLGTRLSTALLPRIGAALLLLSLLL